MMRFKNENAVKCYKSHVISAWSGIILILFAIIAITVELDVMEMPISQLTAVWIFLLIIGVLMCISGFSHIVFYSVLDDCTENEIKMLDNEMSKGEWFAAPQLYLTENYIISFAAEPKWLAYKDILMIYQDSFSINGITANKGITILNKNGKEMAFCGIMFPIFKKRGWNYDKELKTAFVKIKEKNSSIFVGYDSLVLEELKNTARY